MYLLAPFILQNFKKILRADPELWDVPFWGKWPICPEKIFLVQTIIIPFIYLLALFTVQNSKNCYSGSRVMRMRNFWTQNGAFAKIRIFQKTCYEPCFFHSCLSTCQKSKSDINLLVKYWRLKITEISLAKRDFRLTWEPDFSQEYSFCRMSINHKNFHFTQILDKTNDVIFLKIPETMFLGHFWPFLVTFTLWGFFPTNLYMSP